MWKRGTPGPSSCSARGNCADELWIAPKDLERRRERYRPARRATKVTVPLAKECFEFGVIWMLREKEVAQVTAKDVELDWQARLVRLTWPDSKTDQEANGVTRVLQCVCDLKPCAPSCPLLVSATLVERMGKLRLNRAGDRHDGRASTKAQMVQQWQKLFGSGVTGHSARRTGALRLIRAGWSLAQVAFLGRWKSEVVYEYAAEALEALPVNNSGAFKSSLETKGAASDPIRELSIGKKVEQVRTYLSAELAAFKQDQEEVLKALRKEVSHLRDKEDSSQGLIPSWVQSQSSKVTHRTVPFSYCSPPDLWRSLCGWHFHQSNFVFLESADNQLLCQKCRDLAQGKEEVK